MLSFPVNLNTFKKTFFDGDGNLEISTDQDIWKLLYDSNQPFTKDKPSIVQIKVGAGATKAFQFGEAGADGLKLSTGVSGEAIGTVKLIWPGTNDPLIAGYGLQNLLKPGHVYGAILFSAKAGASVKGSAGLFPGPLKASFGVGAGANVGYDRLVLFNDTQSARDILDELFGGIRLPQSVKSVGEIAEPGEVLAFRYGGYINLSASVAWGYSLTGTRELKVMNLDLALKYAVRLAASASLQYRLAGDFSLEHQKGKDANWARFVVRKNRETSFQFAADFGFEASAELSGLPDTPDKLLSALLGTDVQSILGVLATVEENSTLEGLEKTVGKLTKKFLYDQADEWIGKALNESTVKDFLAVVQQVVDTYQKIDEKIIHLYEDFLDSKIPGLEVSLKLLLGADSRADLEKITDGPTWDLVRRLWNEKFHDLLLEDTEFQKFSAFVQDVKDFLDGGADKHVRDIIAKIKQEFPLDGLLNKLAALDTPDKLKTLADEKLQALVGRIIGRTFSGLSSSADFQLALKQVQAVFAKIEEFRNAYAAAIKLAAHQSVALQLNYLYKRATKGEALLDLEIDLNQAEGPEMASLAMSGDFVKALARYNPQVVRINKGKFTHELTKSAQVNVSIFNWNYKGIVEVVQNSEHSVESIEGGLLHVYSIDTSNTQTTQKTDWHKFKEKVRSNFLLSVVGQAPQPVDSPSAAIKDDDQFLVETLRSITVNYDLAFEDDRTEANEMTQYLRLAEYLRLIPSVTDAMREFQEQFPNGLGKVTVNYVVRYDDAAVRNGLTGTSSEDLKLFARSAARQLIAAKFTGMSETDWQGPLGFAYLDSSLYEKYREIGNRAAFAALTVDVPLPDWFAKQGAKHRVLRKEDLFVLATFYDVEDRFVKRIGKLSELVRSSPAANIPEEELRAAALDFVDMADDLDHEGSTNTFFAVFDRVAQQGLNVGGTRKSAVVIEITPVGEDKTVTKYLMA